MDSELEAVFRMLDDAVEQAKSIRIDLDEPFLRAIATEPDNLVRCWDACGDAGFDLWSGDEPLDLPRPRPKKLQKQYWWNGAPASRSSVVDDRSGR